MALQKGHTGRHADCGSVSYKSVTLVAGQAVKASQKCHTGQVRQAVVALQKCHTGRREGCEGVTKMSYWR
jgi:hypothetical protein